MNCLNVYTSSSKNRPKMAPKIGRSPKCLLNCLPGLWSQVPSLSPSRRRRHRFHSRRLAHEAMHQHRVINGPLERMCVGRAACLSRSASAPRWERDANTRHYHLLQSILRPDRTRTTLALIYGVHTKWGTRPYLYHQGGGRARLKWGTCLPNPLIWITLVEQS